MDKCILKNCNSQKFRRLLGVKIKFMGIYRWVNNWQCEKCKSIWKCTGEALSKGEIKELKNHNQASPLLKKNATV